jgi:hypothetical protein
LSSKHGVSLTIRSRPCCKHWLPVQLECSLWLLTIKGFRPFIISLTKLLVTLCSLLIHLFIKCQVVHRTTWQSGGLLNL